MTKVNNAVAIQTPLGPVRRSQIENKGLFDTISALKGDEGDVFVSSKPKEKPSLLQRIRTGIQLWLHTHLGPYLSMFRLPELDANGKEVKPEADEGANEKEKLHPMFDGWPKPLARMVQRVFDWIGISAEETYQRGMRFIADVDTAHLAELGVPEEVRQGLAEERAKILRKEALPEEEYRHLTDYVRVVFMAGGASQPLLASLEQPEKALIEASRKYEKPDATDADKEAMDKAKAAYAEEVAVLSQSVRQLHREHLAAFLEVSPDKKLSQKDLRRIYLLETEPLRTLGVPKKAIREMAREKYDILTGNEEAPEALARLRMRFVREVLKAGGVNEEALERLAAPEAAVLAGLRNRATTGAESEALQTGGDAYFERVLTLMALTKEPHREQVSSFLGFAPGEQARIEALASDPKLVKNRLVELDAVADQPPEAQGQGQAGSVVAPPVPEVPGAADRAPGEVFTDKQRKDAVDAFLTSAIPKKRVLN